MTDYGRQFFMDQHGGVRSARQMLPFVLEIVRPSRIVDVGCGIGAWTRVARDLGCEVTGIDGDWVPRDQLLIAPAEFRVADLASPPEWPERYDLAISLEVAEHLPASSAGRFVDFLTTLAPCVLFSAAVPCQRGTGHVNEQLPSYWAALFERRGFRAADLLRPWAWNNKEIEFYYRQNALLFFDPRRVTIGAVPYSAPLDVIHPDALPILARGWYESLGTAKGWALFRQSLRASIARRLRTR